MTVEPTELLQAVVNGLVTGSVLALGAIGATLVYGVLRLANFAHGDLITLGAYAGFLFYVDLTVTQALLAALGIVLVLDAAIALDVAGYARLHRVTRGGIVVTGGLLAAAGALNLVHGGARLLLATVLAVVATAGLAAASDPLVWAPLRRRRATLLTGVITSIGLALILRHVLAIGFGTDVRTYGLPVVLDWVVGPVRIASEKAAAIVVAAALIVAVHVLLSRTQTGKAMRAMADDLELARVTGIDVDRLVRYVWAIGGLLAAVAGVLLALIANVHPELGWSLLLPIFAAVILGGIGSPMGALAGALVIGVAMEVTTLFAAEYKSATAFVLLIAALVVRPQGLFGVRA